MTEKQKMLAGELYRGMDPELLAEQRAAQVLVEQLNASPAADPDARMRLLRALLGSVSRSGRASSATTASTSGSAAGRS